MKHQNKEVLFGIYPTAKEEIQNAMVLASLARLNLGGKLGCIGNRTVFFLANHEAWRRKIFGEIEQRRAKCNDHCKRLDRAGIASGQSNLPIMP